MVIVKTNKLVKGFFAIAVEDYLNLFGGDDEWQIAILLMQKG